VPGRREQQGVFNQRVRVKILADLVFAVFPPRLHYQELCGFWK